MQDRLPKAIDILRKHGFVFETPLDKPDAERTVAERWEKLAFSFYTDLADLATAAEALLGGEGEDDGNQSVE